MSFVQRLISAGFATAALASATVPALAWSVWPDVDFEWYADVGKASNEVAPPPREGYEWQPGHWMSTRSYATWVAGRWVEKDRADARDRYAQAAPLRADDGRAERTAPELRPDLLRR